jgi:hypothetical protein
MSHCKSFKNKASSVFGNDSNDSRTHFICGIPATSAHDILSSQLPSRRVRLKCTKLQTYLLFYRVMKLGLSEIKSEEKSKSRLEKAV